MLATGDAFSKCVFYYLSLSATKENLIIDLLQKKKKKAQKGKSSYSIIALCMTDSFFETQTCGLN